LNTSPPAAWTRPCVSGDAETDKAVATLEGHTNFVCDLTFAAGSPDGQTRAAGGIDRNVAV
jgi:hypothetical protein